MSEPFIFPAQNELRDLSVVYGKTRLSEIIEGQKQAMEMVCLHNKHTYFPDPNPDWNISVDSNTLWEEAKKLLDSQNEIANRQIGLDGVLIDMQNVLLGQIKTEEWKYFPGNHHERDHYVLIGELVQARGHITVINARTGIALVGVHPHNFYIIPPGEA